MKFKTIIPYELEIEVEGSYTPSRPAPHAVSHDDPKWSDPGDEGELEYEANFTIWDWKNKVWVKIPVPQPILDLIAHNLEEEIEKEMEDARYE